LLLFLAINIPRPLGLNCVLIILAEVCVWTYIAPISAVSMSAVPPRLRARSSGLQIFVQHVLGDVISPPILGAVSDAAGSLQTALQLTWLALLLNAAVWVAAYWFLPPLEYTDHAESAKQSGKVVNQGSGSGSASSSGGSIDETTVLYAARGAVYYKEVSYYGLLCGADSDPADAVPP
jgi:hypothetical protein